MSFLKSLSLRFKVLAILAVSIFLIISLLLLVSTANFNASINQQYVKRAQLVVQTLNASIHSQQDLDSKRMQRVIESLMELNPALDKISLYVPEKGKIVRIAGSDKKDIGKAARPHDTEPFSTGKTAIFEHQENNQKLVEVLSPIRIQGKLVAVIGIYMDLAERDALITSQQRRFIFLGVLGIVFLLTFLYVALDWLLIKPLNALKLATKRVRGGDHWPRIKVDSDDEMGELASHFDEMLQALEQREAENIKLQKELNRNYKRAKEEAITDSLTGLYNHRYFQNRLEEELRRATSNNQPLSLLFCDLDHFKAFNDLNGHLLGDKTLQDIAQIIQGLTRGIDIVARYGGEEFTVILSETDGKGAEVIAEKIRKEVEEFPFKGIDSDNSPLTISIGIATHPTDAHYRRDLIDKADWSMYYAKRKGRNQVRRFSVEKDAIDRVTLEQLRDEEFYINAVHILAALVDSKNGYRKQHSKSVARYGSVLARQLHLGKEEIRQVSMAGLLHDIGKIGIPNDILNKEEKLKDEEWKQIRSHPLLGENILEHIKSLQALLPIILHHHEYYDGSGYPKGLKGEEIPLEARILCVVDAYQAMISERPYREAYPKEEALKELRKKAGIQFDPKIVEAFVEIIEENLITA